MASADDLPDEIRRVFVETGYGCLAAETDMGVVHVCHAAGEDIESFANQPVRSQWQLIEMPTAPLIRLELVITDQPDAPYLFESFLNVADEDQAAILAQLTRQEHLYLAFYDGRLKYRYSESIPHESQQAQLLDELVKQARRYWLQIPPGERDFDKAKAEFIQGSGGLQLVQAFQLHPGLENAILLDQDMANRESQSLPEPQSEIMDPGHFYAAYVFDQAVGREADIQAVLKQAQELGYPVRYWWLSEAIGVDGQSDRLIVCVHHPSHSEDAGLDLYQALEQNGAAWDELDAAAVEEYSFLGKPVQEASGIQSPDGRLVFPPKALEDQITFRTSQAAALLLVTKSSVRDAAEETLDRELSDDEFNAILAKFSKAIDWLDWTPYLDEAIRICQKDGLVGPASDLSQPED